MAIPLLGLLAGAKGLEYLSNQGWFGKSQEQQAREAREAAAVELASKKNQITSDIQSLLDKLSAQRQGLYSETESAGSSFLEGVKGQHKQRMSSLSDLLRQREEQSFSEAQPSILEDLSSRGLLHSSGVGESLAKERGKLARESENALQRQSLADMDTEQRIAEDIQNRLFGIKSGGYDTTANLLTSGLERKYSLEDIGSQYDLTREIAGTGADTAQQSSLYQLLGELAPLLAGGGK